MEVIEQENEEYSVSLKYQIAQGIENNSSIILSNMKMYKSTIMEDEVQFGICNVWVGIHLNKTILYPKKCPPDTEADPKFAMRIIGSST